MELWIRSQSEQTLIKAEKIFIENEELYATTNSEFNERIGIYNSRERAFEVLDEIQEHLDYLNIGNINRVDEKGFRVCTIYEMPKE